MAKYKYRLPGWIISAVRSYVRGYDDLRVWYGQQRQDIIHGSGGETVGHSYDISRPVECLAARLAELDNHPNSRRLAAIDQALICIGNNILDDDLRLRLRQAVLLNCGNGREYQFEIMDLDGIDRNYFYRTVNKFIYQIALREGLILHIK